MDDANSGRQMVIVDEHPLRGAGLESVFSKWAENEGLKIRRVNSFEKVVRAENIDFEMCLLSLGGMSLSDARGWQIFSALKKRFFAQPLIVLSDVGTDNEVRLAYLGGARSLIRTSMPPQVVVAALSFIRSGGEYFPPSGWRERIQERVPESGEKRLRGLTEVPPIESSEAGDRGCAFSVGFSAPLRDYDGTPEAPCDSPPLEERSLAPPLNKQGLTKRQDDVLELVKVGRSNKEIARALNLSESTVKIHVRQLMKKMGAANRTQVAFRATQQSLS